MKQKEIQCCPKQSLKNYCSWVWLLIWTIITTLFGVVFFGAVVLGIFWLIEAI